MKFHHNQKMNIKKGYYSTHKGLIKGYQPQIKNVKTGETEDAYYIVLVEIDNKPTEIKVHENEMKPAWF